MSLRAAFLLTALTFVCAYPASAQPKERLELTVFTGFTTLNLTQSVVPGGRSLPFDNTFSAGFQVGARFGVHLRERLTVETSYRYSPNGKFTVQLEDSFLEQLELEVPLDFGSHAFHGNLLYALSASERLRPFVTGGAGLEWFRIDDGHVEPSVNLGGGLWWRLRPGLALRGDARYVLWPGFFLTEETEGALELHAGLAIGF